MLWACEPVKYCRAAPNASGSTTLRSVFGKRLDVLCGASIRPDAEEAFFADLEKISHLVKEPRNLKIPHGLLILV